MDEDIPGYLRGTNSAPLTIDAIKARMHEVGITLSNAASGGSMRKSFVAYARANLTKPLGLKPYLATSGFGITGDHTSVESAQKALLSLGVTLAMAAQGIPQGVEVVWTAVRAIRECLSGHDLNELDLALRGGEPDEPGDDIEAMKSLRSKQGKILGSESSVQGCRTARDYEFANLYETGAHQRQVNRPICSICPVQYGECTG
jgi:hypothetical protein